MKRQVKDAPIYDFFELIGVEKQLYVVTFIGYLIGFGLQGTALTLMIPLTKGLIEKDYNFIFDNVLVGFIVQFFPFIQNLSDTGIFFLFATAIVVVTTVSMGVNYLIFMYTWNKKEMYTLIAGKMLLDTLLSADSSLYIKYKVSELRSRLEGVLRFVRMYIDYSQSAVQKYFEMIMSIVLLFIISSQLATIAVSLIALSVLIFYVLKNVINLAAKKATLAEVRFGSFVQELLDKKDIIQSYDTNKKEGDSFKKEYEEKVDQRKTIEKINRLVTPLSTVFQIIAISIMGFIIGSTLFYTDVMSVPAAVMFIALFQRAMTKSAEANMVILGMRGLQDTFKEILEDVLKDGSVKVQSGDREFKKIETGIAIKNLSYSYDTNKVFSGLNAEIPAEKLTLITGPNGSGKSTLVSLLMKLRETPPQSIFVNNIDIREFENSSWKKNISYVAQDITLFNGSVRENITYGHDDTSDEEIITVLERVDLWQSIQKLEHGLETNIADNGRLLSGGQRQRIIVARALLQKPEIVIFDEATKSVDQRSEEIIWDILEHDLKGITRIVVSHNKEHEKRADRIIRLQ